MAEPYCFNCIIAKIKLGPLKEVLGGLCRGTLKFEQQQEVGSFGLDYRRYFYWLLLMAIYILARHY